MFLRNRKLYLSISVVIIVFLAGILFSDQKNNDVPFAKAAAGQNVRGFAWSENIGWICFNSLDCDVAAPPGPDYGVNVDLITRELSGYAWSENIGWISFNRMTCQGGANSGEGCSGNSDCASNICLDTAPGATGTPPGAPYNVGGETYTAKINATNNLTGWARVLANGGGWDGWIKFNNAAPAYGVNLNGVDFEGFGWSDMVVGWVSFSSKNCNPLGTGSSGIGGCPLPVGTPISNYKVYLSAPLNNPPTANNLNVNLPPDFCVTSPAYIFGWTFSDPDLGDSQSKFQLQIDNNNDFSSPTVDSVVLFPPAVGNNNSQSVYLTSAADSSGAGLISYGTTYYWRVMVWDSANKESAWIYPPNINPLPAPQTASPGISLQTEAHAWPTVAFTPPAPNSYLVNQEITFNNTSQCYGTPASCTWNWNFGDGSPITAENSAQNPKHTYTIDGSYDIILTVTDVDGHSCSNPAGTKMLGTVRPKWKEVVPK